MSEVELNSAVAALAQNRPSAALELLIESWRKLPWAQTARLLFQLSETLTARRPPVERGKSGRERLQHFLEMARRRDPADVGRLLADLDDVLGNPEMRTALPRLDELAGFGPDPRVSRFFFKELQNPRLRTLTARRFWTHLVSALEKANDPELVRSFDGIQAALGRARLGSWEVDFVVAPRLEALEAKGLLQFPHGAPVPTPAGQQALDALSAALSEWQARGAAEQAAAVSLRSELTEPQLLEAIYDAPDDDGRRLVYADWLAERDDPRGTFITLQFQKLRGEANEKALVKERSLLRQYQREWLGPLAPEVVQEHSSFERGFLSVALPRARRLYEAEASFVRPEWATVRVIHFGEVAHFTSAFRGLKEAQGVSEAALSRLGRLSAPLGLERMTVRLLDDARHVEDTLDALAETKNLPKLRRLALLTAHWAKAPVGAWLSKLPEQLEELELAPMAVRAAKPERWVPWLFQLAKPGLKRLVFSLGGKSQLELGRGDDGGWNLARYRVGTSIGAVMGLDDRLQALFGELPPRSFKQLTLVQDRRLQPQHRAFVEKQLSSWAESVVVRDV